MSINPKFRDHINFRDLGGYKTSDGRHTKHGQIFRSGGIYLMNSDEISELYSLGIKNILDLRTAFESDELPDPELPGITNIRHSGLVSKGGESIDFSPAGMNKVGHDATEQYSMLKEYYKAMPFSNEAIGILIEKLLEGESPIIVHCATGKDRTGVASMVVLTALGVPRETVLRDYLLSNDYHRDTISKTLNENKDRIEAHPELEELLTMRTGVSEKIGRSVLESMYTKHGSIDEYLYREFDLTEEKLNLLRRLYLE